MMGNQHVSKFKRSSLRRWRTHNKFEQVTQNTKTNQICVKLCCGMLRRAVPCYSMLCYAMLCYAMLCCAVLENVVYYVLHLWKNMNMKEHQHQHHPITCHIYLSQNRLFMCVFMCVHAHVRAHACVCLVCVLSVLFSVVSVSLMCCCLCVVRPKWMRWMD